jgi:hypothetical protein
MAKKLKLQQETAVIPQPGIWMQQVCATLGPLHLLTFGEALADHDVHPGFGQA